MDMFSPVKDAIEDSTVDNVKITSKNTTKTPLPFKNDILSSGIIDDLKTRIVNKVGETLDEVGKLSKIGNGDSVLPDASSKKRVAFTGHESTPNNNSDDTITKENDNTTIASVTNNDVNHTNHNGATLTKENTDTTTSHSNGTDHINHNTTTTINENVDTSTSDKNNSTSTATNFQLQVIGSVVDECLQDFRISLRNDIQNMHLELLRQFHIQKVS